jgi:hypothetical protein
MDDQGRFKLIGSYIVDGTAGSDRIGPFDWLTAADVLELTTQMASDLVVTMSLARAEQLSLFGDEPEPF